MKARAQITIDYAINPEAYKTDAGETLAGKALADEVVDMDAHRDTLESLLEYIRLRIVTGTYSVTVFDAADQVVAEKEVEI